MFFVLEVAERRAGRHRGELLQAEAGEPSAQQVRRHQQWP